MTQTYHCYYSTPNDLISNFMGQVVEKGFKAQSDFELVFLCQGRGIVLFNSNNPGSDIFLPSKFKPFTLQP